MNRGRAVVYLVVLLHGLSADAQSLHDEVRIEQMLTPAAVLRVIAEQTGVRFAGLGRLPASAARRWALHGEIDQAVGIVEQSSNLLITRTGLYDYLAVALPAPREAGPRAEAGALRVEVLGTRRSTERRDGRAVLTVILRISGPDLALARIQRLDLDSLRLTDEQGRELHPITEAARAQRFRRGGEAVAVPFGLPEPEARVVTLSGQLFCNQEMTPVTLSLSPTEPGSSAAGGGLEARLMACEQAGGSWRLAVALIRERALDDDPPWLDAVIEGSTGRPYRPMEISFDPRDAGIECDEEQRATACHFLVPLPEGVAPALLRLRLLRRHRPWERVPFRVTDLTLPAALGGEG